MNKTIFHANGKLLLSGEYFVLDGALALALPVNKGQSLDVSFDKTTTQGLFWRSLNVEHQTWFTAQFSLPDLNLLQTSDTATGEQLLTLLRAVREMNPFFLQDQTHYSVTTDLEFPRLWGFGSSSTLIHLLGQWGKVDPFILLEKTMGGSGYDIACAGADGPLFYQLKDGKPVVERIAFKPDFAEHLFFVYLGKKQNSREGIQRYRAVAPSIKAIHPEISKISRQIAACTSLETFTSLILEHERLVATALGLPRAKELYFSDFPGEVKSLGAWGGDFVLLAGAMGFDEVTQFCHEKGFEVVLRYSDLVLS